MTTPTLQIAESVGLVEDDYFGRSHFNELTEAKLQAFREAVEAESDAERMKQDAVGEVRVTEQTDFVEGKYIDYEYVVHADLAVGTYQLYAKPFPSTEQLQQRVKELARILLNAREFVDRHSEPWYTSGQDLLKEIDDALTNIQ